MTRFEVSICDPKPYLEQSLNPIAIKKAVRKLTMRRILTLMTKREVFKLLKLISIYYDSFDLQQEKVDEWCGVLKGESYQKLEENLRKHVAYSPYPPKVSELLCKPESGARAIPNGEDTKYIIYVKEKPASKEVVERSLAQIREILGIQRGEN